MALKWILIAESSGARIFKTSGRSPELQLVKEFSHPEGREKNQAFDTDKQGRSFDSMGQGRHAMGPEVEPHRHEQQVFMNELAAFLDQGFDAQQFQDLILVAAPRLLGEIRQALPEKLHKRVVEELDKNFPMWMKSQEVVTHLKKDLFSLQAVGPE